jgi:ribosome maturation factor RimP
MRGDSRHAPSRPERSGGRAAGPRRERRPQAAPGASRSRPPSGPPAASVGADRLTRLLGPVASTAGMDLEEVRVATAGRRLLLRVVVDADGGVGLDEIALISREVSAVLDADDELGDAPYTLEVSSPGVDRPLTQPKHWRRALGRLVSVSVAAAGDGRGGAARRPASVQGRVVAVTPDHVTLEIDGDRREFGFDDLGPGRVQVEFGKPAGADGDDGGDGGEHDGY